MKFIYYLLKKIVISSFVLYGYNLIAFNFNLLLPFNLFTVVTVTSLGSSGLFGLVLFKYLFLWGKNAWNYQLLKKNL